MLSLFAYQTQIALSSDRKVTRKGNRHPTITPYETFATKDGYINVAVGSESHWKAFCQAISKAELTNDPLFVVNSKRVENREALESILVPVLKRKNNSEWLKLLNEADVPAGTINTVRDALNLQAVAERSMVEEVLHPSAGKLRMVGNPIKLSGGSKKKTSAPPLLGQHTAEILKSIGYKPSDIKSLRRKKVI